jgi:hypothetical protein
VDLWTLIELIQTPYCERAGSGPLAEPLNAISNLAFVLAAIIVARQMRRYPRLSQGARLLPWSFGVVAMGSALYHTYRSPLTYLLDVVPLSAFILAAVYLALRKILASRAKALLFGAAFGGVQLALLALVPNRFLDGSTPYLVPLAFIAPVMVWTAHRYGRLARDLAVIGGLFALAFAFRVVDMAVCPWFPLGTHFLWHITAGAAGYALMLFVFRVEAADQSDSGAKQS